MNFLRFWLPTVIAAVSLTASAAHAACDCGRGENDVELNERDFDAVADYINSKRTIELQEKACNLAISGDVRAEWAHIKDKVNGIRRRGGGATDCTGTTRPLNPVSGTPNGQRIGSSDFDVELNLHFDYKCDRSWAVAQLQFDNPMGVKESNKYSTGQLFGDLEGTEFPQTACDDVDDNAPFGSGRCDGICLRKAYFGYNVCADGCTRFDVEIGRRRFYDVFDSRIEFDSQFDGVLLRYATQIDCCSDAYINLAGFVIDERANHFGWAVEAGMLNICDSGFDAKYSFIDWHKKGQNRAGVSNARGWQFEVHQFLGYYHFDDEILCMPAKAYGAFLFNGIAAQRPQTNQKKRGHAWYIGALVGEVCREGDWSLDVNYQYVQAQAIPDADVSGIGRDNPLGETFTQWNTAPNARGNANFKGWRVEGLYALTDNLSLDATFQYARSADTSIGGKLNYSKWKLAAIYAF